MKSTSEYWFERNDNSRSAVQQKYFLQRNEPRGKLDKPHPSRSLNKDKKCDWKPLAPKIFAFVGMLLVFLVVNLICALPLFCFEKASRERERERALTFRNISLVYSLPFIEHQALVITTYIEGNSIFVLGPAETKFMGGEIYQPLKRNISLKRFHCFAFFLFHF